MKVVDNETGLEMHGAGFVGGSMHRAVGGSMPKRNKPAGYVGLLLAKHHLGRTTEDYDPEARPKKTARSFNINRMRVQQSPTRPSQYIENIYGNQRQRNIPLSAAQRQALRAAAEAGDQRAIAQLAAIRQAEAARQQASRARRRQGAGVLKITHGDDESDEEMEDSDEEMRGNAYYGGFMKGLEYVSRNM
jgi:hypothetical protein